MFCRVFVLLEFRRAKQTNFWRHKSCVNLQWHGSKKKIGKLRRHPGSNSWSSIPSFVLGTIGCIWNPGSEAMKDVGMVSVNPVFWCILHDMDATGSDVVAPPHPFPHPNHQRCISQCGFLPARHLLVGFSKIKNIYILDGSISFPFVTPLSLVHNQTTSDAQASATTSTLGLARSSCSASSRSCFSSSRVPGELPPFPKRRNKGSFVQRKVHVHMDFWIAVHLWSGYSIWTFGLISATKLGSLP